MRCAKCEASLSLRGGSRSQGLAWDSGQALALLRAALVREDWREIRVSAGKDKDPGSEKSGSYQRVMQLCDSGFGIIAEENKFRALVPQLIEHDPDLRICARCVRVDVETELEVPAHDRAALELCDVDTSLRELSDNIIE